MNGKKRNLISDTEAVSGVIGAILLMAIAVTMLTMLQATMVPYWNKQVEATEIKVTYDDMMFLPSDIDDVAIHETPKTCTVQLGAHYPARMIFRNPGPGAFGTLAVEEEPASVTVTYFHNGSKHTKTFDSKRITYQMAGMINSPTLVYEHGAIITDWGTVNLTTDEQTLIDRNEDLYIPIVNGSSRSKSAIGSETMAIFPYLYNDSINVTWVNVTLDTRYPELWSDTLLNASRVLEELNLQDTDVGVDFVNNRIYINNTALMYLKYPNQTASEPLYAGMISCSAEDPDGGDDGGGLWVAGEGTDIMAIGSRVANIPSSENATAIVVQDMVIDETLLAKLDDDFITITVTDDNWNWWKAQINLINASSQTQIQTIELRSANGISDYILENFAFNQSTVIDLFNESNFELSDDDEHGIGGLYQNASVGSNNRLVTNIADKTHQKFLAMIAFRLLVDGD